MTAIATFPSFDATPIFLQPGRDDATMYMRDIQSTLGKMKDLYEAPVKMITPKNPCATDLAKTGCKDAQCLKRFAESLSGGCAELLLRPALKTAPEPSPAPMPHSGTATDVVSMLLGQHEAKASKAPMRMADERRRAEQEEAGQGYFTMITTDGDGHEKRISGPIGSAKLPPELAQLTSMIPDLSSQVLPDIATMLGGFAPIMLGRPIDMDARHMERKERPPREEYPTASIGDDPEEVAAARKLKNHPCGDEIMQCRQVGGHSTGEIKQCLLEHLDQLSSRCKCFINQVEAPEKVQRQLPAAAKAAAAPAVPAVAMPATRVIVLDDSTISAPGPHPPRLGPHGGPCFFMMATMTATAILFVLILRKCLRCCRVPAPAPTMAIVVPPEQTSIKLMEPLRADDIKTITVAH